jgi:hypothetical protein
VFGVAPNQTLWHNWQTQPGNGWSGWQPLGHEDDRLISFTFAVGANRDGRLEAFGSGPDLTVFHNWQRPGGTDWSGWQALGPADGQLRMITVAADAAGRLAVIGIGTDACVYVNRQAAPDVDNWSGWTRIGNRDDKGRFVDAQANQDGRIEVFLIGTAGDLFHAWEDPGSATGWSTWRMFGNPSDRGSWLDAARNNDGRLEVFLVGTAGDTYHTWQLAPNTWPRRDPVSLSNHWAAGGLHTIGGWATLDLHGNGDVRFHGHTHDSGAESYDYGVTAFLRVPGQGIGIAAHHRGRVEGWVDGPAPDRDDLWDDPITNDPMVALHFDALQTAAGIELTAQYEGSITSVVDDVLDLTIRWLLGSQLIATGGVAFVVFAGAELLSLAGQGDLLPSARVLEGYLWLAGPYGTLIAVASDAIAAIGEEPRRWTSRRTSSRRPCSATRCPRAKICC